MRKVAFLVVALLLTSCASVRLFAASDDDVYPTASIGSYDYFWYYAQTDPFHPPASEKGEKLRIERFRRWLTRNGYKSPEVMVVARKVERMHKRIGMKVYEIKYLMKVREPRPQQEHEDQTGTGQ